MSVPASWTGADGLQDYPAIRLDQLVERQAVRTPEAVALQDGAITVSYSDLMRRARRLAHALGVRGIGREDLVAVCLDRSIEQIVGVLGVLAAGAAYVPIDPCAPDERRRFLLEDSKPRAIVTSAAVAELLPPEARNLAVVLSEPVNEELSLATADAGLPSMATASDLAYVIYTSGSTGTPKGVLNQHDGVSNHLAWMAETFPLTEADRVLAKTPAVFDVSVWEWFWPLSQGARLVLAPRGSEKDPVRLIDAIEVHRITNIHFVPTLLRAFLERPNLDRCSSLQRVICSGEALTPELRGRFFERMPGSPALIDLYGPTETAVHVTGWICTAGETGPVPIGRPLPNVRAYIVDAELNPVAAGVKGELLIGGRQVARGYLRRPELTAERFLPDPFVGDSAARCYRTGDCVAWRADGAIDFFGRFDSQVQLGGVRVELGEIEAILRRHPAVGDAAVLVRETPTSRRLVAYLQPAGQDLNAPVPSTDAIRRFLVDKLPDFMTPARYAWVDHFPVTPTGKLDRGALGARDVIQPPIDKTFEPPREGTEARLAKIWCQVLEIDRIGRHDDFCMLGGDSMEALRLFDAIAGEFGVDLRPGELVRSGTIALLASKLEGDAGTKPGLQPGIVTLRAGDRQPPLYLPPSFGGELFYWSDFVHALGSGRPVHGLTLSGASAGPTDLRALAAELVRNLVAFQPQGPYHFAGYSFSAALALEMAQQLRASGQTVGLLAMIDYGPEAPKSWAGRIRTIGHFIQNLPYWMRDDILQAGWVQVAVRVRQKMTTFGGLLARLGRTGHRKNAERAFDEMFTLHDVPEAYRRLAIDHLEAFYRYEPKVYDGRVLLFRARCRPLFHSLAPELGWEHYAANGFKRVIVACNHGNILTSPHVNTVADVLDKALA